MSSGSTPANQASFLFHITDTRFDFGVLGFQAVEAISSLFQVDISLCCDEVIAFEEVAGKAAVLTVVSGDEAGGSSPRYFHGEIAKLRQTGDNGDSHLYDLQLVPSIWKLSLEQDCRIFQNSTLQSIVATVLKESGIGSDLFKFMLREKELKSQYCVQYNESDLDFIARLLEEEGIFYFFEHSEDKHVLVFCDFPFLCRDLPGNAVIPYCTSDGMVPEQESITAFNLSERLTPDAVTAKSFNYKLASVDLTAAWSEKEGTAEIYQFAGTFGSEQRGRKLAKVRMEEHRSLGKKGKGESNCPRLTPGFTFQLDGAGFAAAPGKYLLLGVEHAGDQPQALAARGGGSAHYWNGFSCVPASASLRPLRRTAKPVIPGMQTAMVTGPPGEEIFHDRFGRVKVQFHWDRRGHRDDRSSCWLRCLQGWGGGGRGMQFIPRVGDEVLVAFLDGDPDRPVIVGSLYNSSNLPLYDPAETKTVSSIKTRSYPKGGRHNFHELRFQDRRGSEEIYLQSERDWNILVKHDKGQVIGNDETLLVKNDRNKTVLMSESEAVGLNKSIRVGADHQETIGANKRETVAANCAETVGLAKELTVGGVYQVSVAGMMNETVAGAKSEEVGLAKAVLVGADLSEQVAGSRRDLVGGEYTIRAGESFQVSCGKSTFRMDSDGTVFINGARINVSASGIVTVTGEDIQLN